MVSLMVPPNFTGDRCQQACFIELLTGRHPAPALAVLTAQTTSRTSSGLRRLIHGAFHERRPATNCDIILTRSRKGCWMSAERNREEVNDLLADALRLPVRLENATRRFRPCAVSDVTAQVRAALLKLDQRRQSLDLSPDDAAIFRNVVNGVRMHLRYLGAEQA